MTRDGRRALRAGFAFLTRLPTGGSDESDWEALGRTPSVFPVVGIVVGVLASIPLLGIGSLADPTVALGYVAAVYLIAGIHHVDGVADLGDAAVVHGDRARRREVLADTTSGVGAILAVGLVVAGLALGGLALAGCPVGVAVAIAVAAEIGAKLGMAAMAALGTATHEGFGAHFTRSTRRRSVVAPVVLSIVGVVAVSVAIAVSTAATDQPVTASQLRTVTAAVLGGSLVGTAIPWLWARRHLGGVSGDVFGAANEVSRVVGLHAGVIAWTLS